ncbi:STT3 domain-containing protein [Flavobacteriaceae bacterium S356]|uniref:STT3 domain-containing protein n=1 Tax=Asprobacillus argus TaxID=3076534 RepID=A0ABU3LD66_9FLAO|nr:STT3 domain-containing protein [Flavobacteriaceae bacterium S356]
MAKKNTNVTTENALPKENSINILWLSRLGLGLIILFAIFLRYEDFSVWKKNKTAFQFQGEYQMGNFDSYYYLEIAKEVQNGDYDNLQEKSRVPNGKEVPIIPPLLSVLAASISSIMNTPIATVAIFLPIFLASLLAPLVFFFCRRLNFNRVASLTAAVFSIISLTYVVRTRIGVFDTDCMNVIFVLLNSYLFYQFAMLETKKRYTYLILGILSSFLFYTWWNTATSVVVLSAIVPLAVALVFFYKTRKVLLKYSVLALIILVGIYFTGDQIASYFTLLSGTTTTVFPNNMSVAELDATSFTYFIEQTSNSTFLFISMLIGIVALCWKLKLRALFLSIPLLLAIAPLFAGNRFMLFSAPILAIGIGYCIQILYNLHKRVPIKVTYGLTLLVLIIGISSTYKKITHNFVKPAAADNVHLLSALDNFTPTDANIWTEWDLGYQIQYYLDRGTYADGEFSDGELYFYNAFPFAANNLAVSANFIRFYNKHGIKGMKTLYTTFSGVENTFNILNSLFALDPADAEKWLIAKQQQGTSLTSDKLKTPQQWIAFLFPKDAKDVYLFIHYKMTQTAAWFKQGNSDLKTGKTKGLPLFLTFNALKEQGNLIKNHQSSVDQTTGIMKYFNQKRYFRSLATFTGDTIKRRSFAMPRELNNGGKDNRFVFQWDQRVGFGAAMSKEMAQTTLARLYLLQEKSPHFKPVMLNTPQYQIWKVTGNAYDIDNK